MNWVGARSVPARRSLPGGERRGLPARAGTSGPAGVAPRGRRADAAWAPPAGATGPSAPASPGAGPAGLQAAASIRSGDSAAPSRPRHGARRTRPSPVPAARRLAGEYPGHWGRPVRADPAQGWPGRYRLRSQAACAGLRRIPSRPLAARPAAGHSHSDQSLSAASESRVTAMSHGPTVSGTSLGLRARGPRDSRLVMNHDFALARNLKDQPERSDKVALSAAGLPRLARASEPPRCRGRRRQIKTPATVPLEAPRVTSRYAVWRAGGAYVINSSDSWKRAAMC